MAVAGHLVQRERGGHPAGQAGQVGEPVAFGTGSAAGAGTPWRWQPVQARVGTEPAADGGLGGQPLQRPAGVGAVADQVDAAVAEVGADQPDQLAGQVQPTGGVPGLPQSGQDRQAHRAVRHKWQVDQHADHDPVVGPGDAVAAGGQRVVVAWGPKDLAAAAAHEGVVGDQPDGCAVSDQQSADEVQQDQAELVG